MMYLSTVVLLAVFYCLSSVEAQSRIVDGSKAEPGQFPYQVAIFYGKHFICGGSIIHEKYVLTAAHCIIPKRTDLRVLVGTNTLSNGTIYHANNTIIHERYVKDTNGNDIALIELTSNMEFGPNVKKIALCPKEIETYSRLIISGWGSTTKLGEPENDSLLFIRQKKVRPKICKKLLQFASISAPTDGILCASTKPLQGACSGDSGGPLVLETNDYYIQVGIAAFILSDKEKNCVHDKITINFYTKVSHYLGWVKDKIENYYNIEI